MDQKKVCLVCGHQACSDCAEDHGTPSVWLTCCRCGFGAVASFWSGEHCDAITVVASGSGVCGYCGHVRCENCQPDQWPNLADGCCNCVARVLTQALGEVA
jgi:hypothetical protein